MAIQALTPYMNKWTIKGLRNILRNNLFSYPIENTVLKLWKGVLLYMGKTCIYYPIVLSYCFLGANLNPELFSPISRKNINCLIL